jgi:hypothetical protein
MCDVLAELHEAMARLAAGFDAQLLPPDDANAALAHLTAIEHMAATLKALVAARVADVGDWRRQGARSAAHSLARATGASVGAAKQLLEVGRRLEQQSAVEAAARRGELSVAQAAAIADAATADPDAADRLVGQVAAGSSLAELRDQCAVIKAAAEPDLEARRRNIHARRRLRAWTDPEGTWHLSACSNIEDGAQIMAALAPIRDQHFAAARSQGPREPPDAYAFDALVTLAVETASPQAAAPQSGRPRRGAPVKLLLRADYNTFLRGFPVGGETCELVGYGPIAMSAVHQLLQTGDPVVAAILTKAKALVGVAHLGRKPNAHQQTALEWLYPACTVIGCSAQARLQTDHRIDWADTHFTMLDFLDRLCEHDHILKTRYGWALVAGTGKRAFVPPSDPRHPRSQPQTDTRPHLRT